MITILHRGGVRPKDYSITQGGGVYWDPQKWLRNLWMTPYRIFWNSSCGWLIGSFRFGTEIWEGQLKNHPVHSPLLQNDYNITKTRVSDRSLTCQWFGELLDTNLDKSIIQFYNIGLYWSAAISRLIAYSTNHHGELQRGLINTNQCW